MHQDPNLVVEFIGRAGAGKTVICQETAAIIRQSLSLNKPLDSWRVINELGPLKLADLSPRSVPRLALAAYQISRIMPRRTYKPYNFRFWLIRLLRLDYHYRHHSSSNALVLSDEGILQILRKGRPVPLHALRALRLPDIVVEVCAPRYAVYWRRAKRRKPMAEHKIYTGSDRHQAAARMSGLYLGERGEEGLIDFLSDWTQHYCSPPLSRNEQQQAIRLASVTRETVMGLADDLRGVLENMGCLWLRVDNPIDQPVSVAVERVSQELLTQLSRHSARGNNLGLRSGLSASRTQLG